VERWFRVQLQSARDGRSLRTQPLRFAMIADPSGIDLEFSRQFGVSRQTVNKHWSGLRLHLNVEVTWHAR
jgi:hypothetical protein